MKATGQKPKNQTNAPVCSYSYNLRQSIVILIFNLLMLELVLSLVSMAVILLINAYLSEVSQFVSPQILLIAGGLTVQIINIFFVSYIVLWWANLEYIIMPYEIIEENGIIRIVETAFSTERIETVKVSQNLWGRIFNYGTLIVYNPVLKADLTLFNIPAPYKYAEIIESREAKETVRFFPKREYK